MAGSNSTFHACAVQASQSPEKKIATRKLVLRFGLDLGGRKIDRARNVENLPARRQCLKTSCFFAYCLEHAILLLLVRGTATRKGPLPRKGSLTLVDNNSIPMGIIIVPNFFGWEKLGTIIFPIGIELLSPTFWEFLSPTFPQKLGTKNPKSWGQKFPEGWGQKFPNPQKLGTKVPKSWGQKIPKVGDKNSQIPKSWGQKFPKVGD